MENIKESNKNNEDIIEVKEVKDWKDIHPNFTKELQKDWENKGFSYEECKKWIDAGLKPKEYEFAVYLKGKKHGATDDVKDIIKKESWKDIDEDFEYRWRVEWEDRKFMKEDCQEWLNIGLKPNEVFYAQQLRDIEQETPKSINELKDKDKYLAKQLHKYEMKIMQTSPLEKLYSYRTSLYFFLLDYRGGKKIIEIVRTLPFDGFYTILQYSNRAFSLVGGSLLLSNSIDNQTGGIIATTSAGIEIFLSLVKDRILGLDSRAKLFDKITEDIEGMYKICKEGRLMLEHTYYSPLSKEMNEIFDILKLRLDKFLVMKNEYLELVDRYRGNNLKLILRPQRTKKMLWKDAKLYGNAIKDLTEIDEWLAILQELSSDYLQGVPKEKTEKKYKIESEKLKADTTWISILLDGIKEISLTETIDTFFIRSSVNSSDDTLKHLLEGYDKETTKRKIFLSSDEEEKEIDKLVNVTKNQIDWESKEIIEKKQVIRSSLEELEKLGYIKKNKTTENAEEKDTNSTDNYTVDLDQHFEEKDAELIAQQEVPTK